MTLIATILRTCATSRIDMDGDRRMQPSQGKETRVQNQKESTTMPPIEYVIAAEYDVEYVCLACHTGYARRTYIVCTCLDTIVSCTCRYNILYLARVEPTFNLIRIFHNLHTICSTHVYRLHRIGNNHKLFFR